MKRLCVELRVSLLAVGAGTLVSQQGLEIILVGLGAFIFAKRADVTRVPPTAQVFGGIQVTFPLDVMAPGAHRPVCKQIPPLTF